MTEDNDNVDQEMNFNYNIISSLRGKFESTLIKANPTEYRPRPTQTDYDRGAIMRYFVRKVNGIGVKATEVDENQYKMFKKNPFYKTTSVIWMIRGPKTDSYQDGIFQNPGVMNSNEREAIQGDKNLNGVFENLNNFTQFWSIFPES